MTPAERFWSRVDSSAGPGFCWPWTGKPTRDGYGNFTGGPGLMSAHRYSYFLATGQHPGALLVRHTCDNPPCVNPEHLLLGTIADNMADRNARGRQAVGERVNHAKYTEATVLEIRRRKSAGELQSVIADSLGVSRPNVSRICRGLTWKHLSSDSVDAS